MKSSLSNQWPIIHSICIIYIYVLFDTYSFTSILQRKANIVSAPMELMAPPITTFTGAALLCGLGGEG